MGFGSSYPVSSRLFTPQLTEITSGALSNSGYNTQHCTVGMSIRLIDILPSVNNPVTDAPWALTPWVYEMGNTAATTSVVTEPRGKIYGIKLLQQNLGNFLDTVTIAVNAQGFMEISGADATHHILTGGPSATAARFAIPA